jgi:hypothetical protein
MKKDIYDFYPCNWGSENNDPVMWTKRDMKKLGREIFKMIGNQPLTKLSFIDSGTHTIDNIPTPYIKMEIVKDGNLCFPFMIRQTMDIRRRLDDIRIHFVKK